MDGTRRVWSGSDGLGAPVQKGFCYQSPSALRSVQFRRNLQVVIFGDFTKDARKYLNYLGGHTSSLTIVGMASKVSTNAENNLSTLTVPFFNTIKLRCNQLKSLSVKNCILNPNEMRSSLFPKTIVNLTLDHIKIATRRFTEDFLVSV